MEEEEAPELISPRISFSHDLANFAAAPPRRSDASLLVSPSPSAARFLPEPEFDFANANAAAAADVAPADRLFSGGKLLPMPPLPPAPPRPSRCKQEPIIGGGGGGGGVKAAPAPACPQKRPGSWRASPFSRSSSVNSATTAAAAGAPRSAGRFGCPPFPLMRSWSASAAVARDGAGAVTDAASGHHRPRGYKKFGGTVAPAGNGGGGGSSRAYYYGGDRKGSGSHGVSVSPVLNVPFIGTSVANVLSYLLCDCSTTKTKKSREF